MKKTDKQALVEIGRQFYERRWMWGTAGNLSIKLRQDPLEIAITPSGANKGRLRVDDLITIQDYPPPLRGRMKVGGPPHPHLPPPGGKGPHKIPSSETAIHQAIYRAVPGAGAVFHIHPVYSTLLSSFYGHPREKRMLKVEWFEMMKGLGVGEEESAEVAILPNWQDVSLIARDVTDYLKTSAKALPVVLIYNHGLTGWGTTPEQARNHLEIMEYVCQYLYLKNLAKRG